MNEIDASKMKYVSWCGNNESTLPDYLDTDISVGTDPTEVTVLAGETVMEEENGYIEADWTP